jgi:hypothetical protein
MNVSISCGSADRSPSLYVSASKGTGLPSWPWNSPADLQIASRDSRTVQPEIIVVQAGNNGVMGECQFAFTFYQGNL